MPRTLRSAQSSPADKAATIDASSNVTPGRKFPKCTKCGQPRLGHPRSGCPSTGSPVKGARTSPAQAKPKSLQENLSEAFSSMYLRSSPAPGDKAEGSKERRNRRSTGSPPLQASETLESISTSAEDILNDLVQPGFFSQATVPDDDEKGSPRRGDIAYTHTPSKVRIKSGPQKLMPGTLIAPSWESSLGGLSDMVLGNEDQKKSLSAESLSAPHGVLPGGDSGPPPLAQSSQSPAPSSPTSASPRSLARSQTQEQRQLFLSSLSQASPASVYIHRKAEIDEVQASAKAAKLHFRVISNDDANEENALFVIGSDLHAVEKMTDDLIKSIKGTTQTTATASSTKAPSDGRSITPAPSTLKAVAGGAIVGAVGTWASLAFS